MQILSQEYINLINSKIYNFKYDGLIFFITDKNYANYVSPLISSLNMYADSWLYIYIKVGQFKSKNYKNNNLIEIQVSLPKNLNSKNKIKTYCANIRVPILYQLSNYIFVNKIIYSDIDNILVNDINKLFNTRKIYLRKVNHNFIDILLKKQSKIMPHKSGVIALKANKNKYLKDDIFIMKFVATYLKICKDSFDEWFSDQISLSSTILKLEESEKFICLNKKFCDWDFEPYSFFWAAKGYIKNTFLWKLLSIKIVFISYLKNKFHSKSKFFQKLLYLIDHIINILLYPILVFRFRFINLLSRIIVYVLKKVLFKRVWGLLLELISHIK